MKLLAVFKLLLACLLIALPAISFAVCKNDNCSNVHVNRLQPSTNSAGTVYIGTSGDEPLMTDYTALNSELFTLYLSNSGSEAVYATLLAALTTDRPVDVVAKVGSTGCEVSYVRFRR